MKKLNKFFAVLVALAMMATLCVMSSFATDPEPTAPVTKVLKIPAGTAIPTTCNATFSFELKSVNGDEPAADETAEIETMSLNMKTATGTPSTGPEANVDTYTYTVSEDALDGVEFKYSGYYEWIVKEATYNAADADDETTDYAGKDEHAYKMVVKVVYDEDGDLVIDDVTIKAGGDENNLEDDDWTTAADGLTFNNTYYATTGNPGEKPNPDDPDNPLPDPDNPGDEDDDDAGLYVKKVVEDGFGDQSQNGKFDIRITLNLPAIGDADAPTAVIRRADETGTIDPVTFTDGVAEVQLSHNDKIVFTEIANGTTYTVEEFDDRLGESGPEGYTVTYDASKTGTLTKDAQSTTVTNKSNKDDQTPTGILISNLPYIALALVAIGGLVAYVVVRRRQNDEA